MWLGCSDTLDAQYHINNINAHIYVMIWSRSYYSITLLSSVQRPSSRFGKITPKSHVLVGNRNVCDRVVAIRWTHNITSITSTAHIYVLIWSRSYYSISLLSSVQCLSSRFVKITPKSHVLVGNRNICDRVVAIRWTHNITSITSTPIYM